ncbi:MAG: F0F1 ATP synthase subunit B [Maritimibacter sp.]|jgi:F-type H+-transporting ATPase subunit b
MKKLMTLALMLAASPALAAEEEKFFSLHSTEFVVTLAFIVFIGVLIYFKVPGIVGGLLDRRAESIKTELEEARALREEAQTILASYERKQKEVADQAALIVEHAKRDAAEAAVIAKQDLKDTIARRLAAAEDQIKSAEASAVKEVRDTAVAVSVSAAKAVIAKQMTATEGNKLIDDSIKDVEAKLH